MGFNWKSAGVFAAWLIFAVKVFGYTIESYKNTPPAG